jgi:hypothetical protein
MRPLPPLQQRRAIGLSVCAHAALAALFLLARPGESPVEPRAAIIEAELIALLPPRTPPAEPAIEPGIPLEEAAIAEAAEAEPTRSIAAPAPPAPSPRAVPEPTREPFEPAPSAPLPAPEADLRDRARDATTAEPLPPVAAAAVETPPARPDAAAPAPILERRAPPLGDLHRAQNVEAPAPTVEWRDAGQRYTAVLTKRPAGDPMSMEQLDVEVTTERDGARLVTQLRMTRVAFSNFAQFIDRWDPNVQIHDDVIDGRFHSNSEIRVSREGGVRPLFNGRVTLAARDFASDGTGFMNRRTLFPEGLETSVRRIVLPPRAAALDATLAPPERTQRIARDASLTFGADGSYEWRHLDGGDGGRGVLDEAPFYVVAAEDASLTVRGIVNGKVLVYSPRRIVIADDIRYADDPRNPGASDYLGLVAERTVEIDEPEVTGPGDLTIQASIYARQRFRVRGYRSRPSGTLSIYGSVTAGSVSATEPRYATKIEFDDRLTTMRAPGFPLSDRYELDSWNGEWRVVAGD